MAIEDELLKAIEEDKPLNEIVYEFLKRRDIPQTKLEELIKIWGRVFNGISIRL